MKVMEDEKARAWLKKVKRREAAAILARITGSLITMLMLLWAIRCGFKLAFVPRSYTVYAARAFHIGVAIVVLGSLFLILGFSILAGLFLNLSELLQEQNGAHQGKEKRTNNEAIAKAFVTIITMLVLSGVTYTGFRLSTESKDNKLYLLTVSIGVTTIVFGLIYLIIGLAIILELAVDFLSCLQQKE